jgi:hypothetical protein
VGAELFHAERQTDVETDNQMQRRTDMTELIFAFRNFAKVSGLELEVKVTKPLAIYVLKN